MDTFLKALDKDSTIQDALSAFQVHGKFSFREIKIIRELIMVLKPFQEATDEWQKDFQSVGTVIPAYLHMKNTLNEFIKPGSTVSVCKDFAKALYQSLEKRFSYVLQDTYYLLGNKIFVMNYFSLNLI